MSDATPNGVRARLDELSRRVDQAEESRRQLWKEINETGKDLAAHRVELRHLSQDIADLSTDVTNGFDRVHSQLRAENEEQRRTTVTEKVALFGVFGVITAAVIQAITTIVGG